MKTSIVVLSFFIGVLLQILYPSEYYNVDTIAPTLDFVEISNYGIGDFDLDCSVECEDSLTLEYDEDFIFDYSENELSGTADLSWPNKAKTNRNYF